ncbi:MAG: Uma2 family endonuclease [Microscillaceae bacterium]|jgi:Uma2 family endonuclease|nr:Uma2 family endonuclease [Microscillaceae bacterium]
MLIDELIDQIQQLSEAEQVWIAEQIQKLLKQEISIPDNNSTEIAEDEAVYSPPVGALYPYKPTYEVADIQAIIAQFPARKKWTFEDLQDERIFPIDLKIRIEIIHNKIYVMPKPTLTHQEIALNIATFINVFVKSNKLGKVYSPPVNVKLNEDNVVEPDVLVVLMPKIELIMNDKAIEGAPDLVVEVISKANYKKLRESKKRLYADFGVEEYWEVYPKKKKIKIETLQTDENGQKNYVTFSEAGKDGKIQSQVLAGFELELSNIFN